MTAVPRPVVLGLIGAFAGYVVVFAAVVVLTGPPHVSGAIGLLLLVVALGTGLTGPDRLSAARTVVVAGAAALLPLLGSVGLDPEGGYGSGAWYVSGVSCLVLLLLWRRRGIAAWGAFAVLVLHTAAWAGPTGLNSFGVVAAGLVLAVLAAGGLALARTADDIARFDAAEREALALQAEQDAYERVREHRLRETARMGGAMLQRIVDAGGRLDPADRRESRVLEQSIRDEIRGRALLDDAVRAEVLRLRRAGAVVQVNDDGGLDGLDPVDRTALLDRIALALTGLSSDRVIIRTAPAGSRIAVTVVAMSVDPVAAALGIDDDEERVDLWLELPRPAVATL